MFEMRTGLPPGRLWYLLWQGSPPFVVGEQLAFQNPPTCIELAWQDLPPAARAEAIARCRMLGLLKDLQAQQPQLPEQVTGGAADDAAPPEFNLEVPPRVVGVLVWDNEAGPKAYWRSVAALVPAARGIAVNIVTMPAEAYVDLLNMVPDGNTVALGFIWNPAPPAGGVLYIQSATGPTMA